MPTIKDRAKAIMEAKPTTREKKTRVIANMWFNELTELNITPNMEMLEAMAEGKLSSPETIRRSICKIWEDHPQLRPSEEVQEYNRQQEERLRRGRGEILD
jgi:hypothetical protein